MKYLKNIAGLFPFVFLVIMLWGFFISGVLLPDKIYSSSENRGLQAFPKLSLKRIMNGKFQKKYETYLSDQFPARDGWIMVRTEAELLMGKRESNGIYFGKDGYLLEKYTEEDFDSTQLKENRRALVKFVKKAQKKYRVKVMLVPSKTKVLSDYLPPFAVNYDEQEFFEDIKERLPEGVLVFVEDELLGHKDEEIYYHTDHHWTTLGAWYGYRAYRRACGTESAPGLISPDKKKDFEVISSDFLGTSQSKINMPVKPDKIEIYRPERDMQVDYNMGEKTENTFYDESFITEKDKYSVFFGGNQAVLEITGGVENGETLLIIKDSFANCMIPFLAEDYERVVVADLRQLNAEKNVLLDMFEPTEVLILYNTVQFMQDKEFAIK